MGIFPHFFGGSPLTHLTHLFVPTLPLFTQSIKAIKPLVSEGIKELHNVGSQQTTPRMAQPMAVQPGVYPQIAPPQAPYITAPNYYPSPFAPSPFSYAPTPDTFSPYGGPSWESSMTSPAVWNPPLVTYSAAPTQPANHTWEDLTSAFLPLIPSLLSLLCLSTGIPWLALSP
jgi:hypothetical protein